MESRRLNRLCKQLCVFKSILWDLFETYSPGSTQIYFHRMKYLIPLAQSLYARLGHFLIADRLEAFNTSLLWSLRLMSWTTIWDTFRKLQMNTAHRYGHYSSETYFKSVQYTGVSSSFQNCLQALCEEEKFRGYIKRDEWALEMYTLRDILLQTNN